MNDKSETRLAEAPTPRQQDGLFKVLDVIHRFREPVRLVYQNDGSIDLSPPDRLDANAPQKAAGILPPLYPEWLGDRGFAETHNCRFPYMVGEMARGITTANMVIACARAGLMSFFGSAGLSWRAIEEAVGQIQRTLGPDIAHWGATLLHSPNEPGQEDAVVDLFLRLGVQRMSASAFMSLTPAIIRYAASGLRQDPDGTVHRHNHVFAKISRPEVAALFLSPPPANMLDNLVQSGHLTTNQADLAAHLPIAEDIT
ncbi:MAG: 2-nitropropane dioxygenase, partial [Pseudomonadota bacterium]